MVVLALAACGVCNPSYHSLTQYPGWGTIKGDISGWPMLRWSSGEGIMLLGNVI